MTIFVSFIKQDIAAFVRILSAKLIPTDLYFPIRSTVFFLILNLLCLSEFTPSGRHVCFCFLVQCWGVPRALV